MYWPIDLKKSSLDTGCRYQQKYSCQYNACQVFLAANASYNITRRKLAESLELISLARFLQLLLFIIITTTIIVIIIGMLVREWKDAGSGVYIIIIFLGLVLSPWNLRNLRLINSRFIFYFWNLILNTDRDLLEDECLQEGAALLR